MITHCRITDQQVSCLCKYSVYSFWMLYYKHADNHNNDNYTTTLIDLTSSITEPRPRKQESTQDQFLYILRLTSTPKQHHAIRGFFCTLLTPKFTQNKTQR